MKRSEMQSAAPSGWLPDDVARCAGVGNDAEGWREGCGRCLRRSAADYRVLVRIPDDDDLHELMEDARIGAVVRKYVV